MITLSPEPKTGGQNLPLKVPENYKGSSGKQVNPLIPSVPPGSFHG
jgi:hypothetical protein